MSQGDLSGMDREVVEERVVAIDAVVASSNEGGVHGRWSARPGGEEKERHTHIDMSVYNFEIIYFTFLLQVLCCVSYFFFTVFFLSSVIFMINREFLCLFFKLKSTSCCI